MKISPELASSAALAILLGWLVAWHPLSWPGPVEPCRLELTASAPGGAVVTVRLDEGHGFDDGTATDLFKHLPADGSRRTIALPLPPMRLRALKLEVSGTSEITIARGRILLGEQELADCGPGWVLDELVVGTVSASGLRVRPVAAGAPLNIEYHPAHSLILPAGDEPWLVEALAYLALFTVILYYLQTALTRRLASVSGERILARASLLAAAARRRPGLVLAGVGICAAAVSSYPVAFCGGSFVSPNNFPYLLYNRQRPTVPGIPREPVTDTKNSDVTALMLCHLPDSALDHDALLRDHELPLWNRYDGGGLPLLGQGQSMFGDPLHFLPILANGASWAWDLKFLLAKALFSFGVGLGVWTLTRRLGVAVLLGASGAWIGFFAFRFNHPAFFSLCYSPWVLLPWLAAPSARTKRALLPLAGGLIAADWWELTSGTAKEASMLLLSLNAAGLLAAIATAKGWRERRRTVAPLLVASGLFVLLSAPHWLVFLDALRQAATVYDIPAAYQLQPGLLAGFFDDIFSQDFTPREGHTHPSANFLALAGALWLAASWRRGRDDRRPAALAGVALGLAALVFGVVPPAWIERTPFIGHLYLIHATLGCPLIVLTLLLAGVGLAHCLDQAALPEWKETYRRTMIGLALVMALYLGFTHAISQPPRFFTATPPWHSRFFVHYVLVLLAAVGILPWALRWTQMADARRFSGYILLGVCLVFLHFRHGMYVRTRFDPYVMTPRLRAESAASSPALEEVRRRLHEPARVGGFDLTFAPGYNALWRMENLAGPDALFNRYNREYTDAAAIPRFSDWWILLRERDLPRLKRIYDSLNLRYYLREGDPGWKAPAGLARVGASDLEIFESKEAWPRAFFTNNLLHYRTPAQLAALVAHGDGRPFAAIQVDPPDLDPSLPLFSGASAASYSERTIIAAENYALTTNTTEFTINAPGDGVIVLGENYEKGNFRVTVNGFPDSCFRVNHTFKGVQVGKAGLYRVRFEYWPRLLTPALWLSAAGAVLTALSAFAFWWKRSPAETASRPAPEAATARE